MLKEAVGPEIYSLAYVFKQEHFYNKNWRSKGKTTRQANIYNSLAREQGHKHERALMVKVHHLGLPVQNPVLPLEEACWYNVNGFG